MRFAKTLSGVAQNELQTVGQHCLDMGLLHQHKFNIPHSFVILSDAFEQVVQKNNLKYKIDYILSHIDSRNSQSMPNAYTGVRKAINSAKLPEGMEKEFQEIYESLASPGVGLEKGSKLPLRIIVSMNWVGDSENNDLVIQDINGVSEFMIAIREAWSLPYHPGQLEQRMKSRFSESKLRIAILVQVMNKPITTVHAYSSMPQDRHNIYLQAYYGYPDLRERIVKDYYAITKETLHIALSEIHDQKNKLEMDEKNELDIIALTDKNEHDKVIRRDLQEIARLTKKAERILKVPVKIFFANERDKHDVLWVNRLGFDVMLGVPKMEPDSLEVVEMQEETTEPEDDYIEIQAPSGNTLEFEDEEATEEETQTIVQQLAEEADTSEDIREGVTAHMLDASIKLAEQIVENKYMEKYGEQGHSFPDMVDRLNISGEFHRNVDTDVLRTAVKAANEHGKISEQEYSKAVDELAMILNRA